MTSVSSPASSGPSGPHFEGQVGAHYLLSMLTGTEPRGLPGTVIDRIELQRAAEGRPLDDVIVKAHDAQGNPAILEIQVKRSINFSSGDPIFRKVVFQISEASCRDDFWTSRYEMAIAAARTSRKIDGAYQDVLTWAREIGDPITFMDRINRPGSANESMRTFVRTFKAHLHDAGAPNNDEIVWGLLRKLQILIFDFTAQGSASEELAKERAVRALHSNDAYLAGNLWTALIELALKVAVSGGDRNRETLVDDLTRQSFHLSGQRFNLSARTSLADASRAALDDIEDQVSGVMLIRHERIATIHAALDEGRYVEIRGDAGVGKSGLLKHFAKQIATEGQVIILSPVRTTPRGWSAMRAELGFDGQLSELLTDLAGEGGAILFIDNLDLFDEEKRKTVVDLIRGVANIPSFAVVTTARRNFGVDEPSWLPQDALNRLGYSEPIIVGELNDTEVQELKHAAPRLAQLLADSHPARAVTRNLFRLARLANRPGNEPIPNTEVDMAVQWWKTADGRIDSDLRDRARLLKDLAEQTLSNIDPKDVSNHPSKAINALVASETLRDLGNDFAIFRHDVLGEWSIANFLHYTPTNIDRLPLDRPAPAILARGVELTSRMILEHEADCVRWQALLERLSRQDVHASWPRLVLLALVHSEVALDILKIVHDPLLSNRASLLRKLIRIVMAVDVEPATKLFAAAGIDPAMIPASFNVPSGPSWYRLITWLLSLEQDLPASVILDVVELFISWSCGLLGKDPLTPLLAERLYHWLIHIERTNSSGIYVDRRKLFNGELDYEQIDSLESNLRIGFLLFCDRTPALASEYIRSLEEPQISDNAVRSILQFSRTVSQAAPAELAELTLNVLIPKSIHDYRQYHRPFLDYEFVPASPAQGPFFELLKNAPLYGLSLIHQLIDRTIIFYSNGRECGENLLNISFPDGVRTFPWQQTYTWSREGGTPPCVTSALMALEAWAHQRVDAGEALDKVLKDVLGPPDAPAAYLLVAVDLIISHWPKSREVAIPFLACPELLCIDRYRHTHDTFLSLNLFGINDLKKEPIGAVSLGSLKKRPSRQFMLDQLLGYYALGPTDLQKSLSDLLQKATSRLGPLDAEADLGDPAFMAIHALNSTDPNNWHEVSVKQPNGQEDKVYKYKSPESEKAHLSPLQKVTFERQKDSNIQIRISLTLGDPSRSSAEFTAVAVGWAKQSIAAPDDEDKHEAFMRKEAIVSAAVIAMRDGGADLRTQHEEWARTIFVQALHTEEDTVHRFRSGLKFNPIAIAFVGVIHILKHHSNIGDIRLLLEAAADNNPAAAHGLGAAAPLIISIDERLLRAVIRCAFSASIRPNRRRDLTEEEVSFLLERQKKHIEAVIEAEIAWLSNEGPEPDWPEFPPEKNPSRRHRIVVGGNKRKDMPAFERPQQDQHADHQAAALWLNNASTLFDTRERPWLLDIIRAYGPWTAIANGADLDADYEIRHLPMEWNDAYFNLLAHCLPSLELQEINHLALIPICSLPDESFFDIMTVFLKSVDMVYFNSQSIQELNAINIRSKLTERLMNSRGWKWLGCNRSTSIEIHIGPAIAALFFNEYGFAQPTKCYLLPQGIDRLSPFLPVLEKLVESGPSLFVAILTLNLIEVSPRSSQLSFVITSADAWLKNFCEDTEFWVAHGIGRRVCLWIEKVWSQDPALFDLNKTIRIDLDHLLSGLISLGVADAKSLEETLATRL